MREKGAFRLTKRAVCMWFREQPALFGSAALYALLNAVIPYITLWFSAQILNELAGARQRELLIQKIVTLLVAETVLLLLKALVFRWNNALSDGFCMKLYEWKRHFDKLISMDFRDVENPDTHKLLNAVQQFWYADGLLAVSGVFGSGVSIHGRDCALCLTVLPASAGGGRLAYNPQPSSLHCAGCSASRRRDHVVALSGDDQHKVLD